MQCDWYPHHWLRWSDAQVEAGYSPNKMQVAIEEEVVIQSYIDLVRELGRTPIVGEIVRKRQSDRSFPSYSVFPRRFGDKKKLLEAVVRWCQEHSGYEDVITLCSDYEVPARSEDTNSRAAAKIATGFVYLMKSGRHYKIGHTICPDSRKRQLTIKIPVPPKTIHSIETDDPPGIEAYWHKRFSDKRGEGEWFELSPEDVAAFKRWKRIV